MKKLFQQIYLGNRLFIALAIIGAFYIMAFFFPFLIWLAHTILVLLITFTIVDLILLFKQKNGISSQRILPDKLSNGDENQVKIDIKNNYDFGVKISVIDEVPFQFQLR